MGWDSPTGQQPWCALSDETGDELWLEWFHFWGRRNIQCKGNRREESFARAAGICWGAPSDNRTGIPGCCENAWTAAEGSLFLFESIELKGFCGKCATRRCDYASDTHSCSLLNKGIRWNSWTRGSDSSLSSCDYKVPFLCRISAYGESRSLEGL